MLQALRCGVPNVPGCGALTMVPLPVPRLEPALGSPADPAGAEDHLSLQLPHVLYQLQPRH